RPVAEALAAVEGWYAARGLPARLAVPTPPGLDLGDDPVAGLAITLGWAPGEPVHVLTAATRAVVSACGGAGDVELHATLTEEWLAALSRYRETPVGPAHGVLEGSPDQRFALIRNAAGAVAAIGRLGVSDGWGGIGAMWVDAEHRRTGLAGAVLGRLALAA